MREYHTINPLVMGVNANQAEEENDEEHSLLDTVLTLLLAKCDPNEFGSAAISPLCQAIRLSDCRAVTQLLQFSADPNQSERNGLQPIFYGTRVASAEYVHLLIENKADPTSEEASDADGDQGQPILQRRIPIEAAARLPRILYVLQNSIPHR